MENTQTLITKLKKVNTWTEERKKQYFVDYFQSKKDCIIHCDCGADIRLYSKYHHVRTKKHVNAMSNLENPEVVIN